MKLAFLVHPLTEQTRQLLELHRSGDIKDVWGSDLVGYLQCLSKTMQKFDERSQRGDFNAEVKVIDEFPHLISTTGAEAQGRLYEIPMLAHQILEEPQRALEFMEQATRDAQQWGASVVGLGSMTGIVGSRGQYLAENTSVAVTTGNSLTVYAALQNLEAACQEAQVDLREEDVVVIGIPGSIATAVARVLARRCKSLLLVGRNSSARTKRLSDELDAPFYDQIPEALCQSRVIVSATSSGACIDQADLRPGSIVVDIGVPTDVIGGQIERDDILVLSGGLARLPDSMCVDSAYFFFQQGVIPSCLGETIVLALEQRAECFSLGQDLKIEKVESIGKLAEKHGFDFSQLYSFGKAIDDRQLIRFAKNNRPPRRVLFAECGETHGLSPLSNGNGNREFRGVSSGTDAQNNPSRDAPESMMQSLAKRSREAYSRHINPILTEVGGELVKTFVKADNCYLWDSEGNRYTDFVAGFGSVNVGHNHPDISSAITRTLQEKAPGFVQSAINPLAAELAERLVMVSPYSLEMVCFTNSGAESVEAALKLARAATGRSQFVYTDRSYHGKTMGALSVTGNSDYQKPFASLLPECQRIPFNDISSLQSALASRQSAAFIVEPIQAEGGMVVPDEGYLKAAQEICNQTGTLLICDEIQTGFGRTGTMFACEQSDVQPDIMTLAKSLSGGAVPIGAMLCRREIWERGYGTAERFALHTSTFAGGSVACATGLAALDVIQDEDLAANAEQLGELLFDGLNEVAREFDLIKEIRGKGLLVGIEFNPLYPSVVSHWKGVDHSMLRLFLGRRLDDLLGTIPALYVMSSLLNRFGIYTQAARSNPLVLRVQPPLTINEEQIGEFVNAVRASVSEIEYSSNLVDSAFSRAGVGNHTA